MRVFLMAASVLVLGASGLSSLAQAQTAPDFTEMVFDLEVWDLKHLNRLLSQLKDNSSVSEARRVNG